MTLYLSEAEVGELLSMTDALAGVEAALVAVANGRATDVPRVRTHSAAGTLHMLQAVAPALGLTGFKYYFTGRGVHASFVHLVEESTAKLRAIVESRSLGRLRTGAASGVATRHLAIESASVVGQIGSGNQAGAQLEAVCAVRPIRLARVFGRDSARLQRFCEQMAKQLGIEVVAAATAEAAVAGAHVVNIITSSAVPVLHGAWLEPGQHINAAGSNSLARRELDAEAIDRCELVVVDSRGTARAECGDLLPAIEGGKRRWERLPELGEVIIGQATGRSGAAQITLYESQGMGIQDLYVAERVVAFALARGLGVRLPMPA
jgi:alanine dehydrogenase